MLSSICCVLLLISLTTAQDFLNARTCVECGQNGNGCDATSTAASYTRLDTTLSGSLASSSVYEIQHAIVDVNKKNLGSPYVGAAVVPAINSATPGTKTDLIIANVAPPTGVTQDIWQGSADQRTLWYVVFNDQVKHIFQLNGFDNCRAQVDAPFDQNSTVFVYRLIP